MSLRRAPGNKTLSANVFQQGFVSSSRLASPTNSGRSASSATPADTPTRSKETWIAAGFLCLFLAGVYLSSNLNNQAVDIDNDMSKSHLRSSSLPSHMLANFRPIHEKCSVWIAQSSVKGLQGYGVFTTRDLARDEHILGVPDGVSIPIIGYWQRHGGSATAAKDAWMKVWDNYW
eukprot:scaffold2768_cov161-Amphora_coffeaeformis.AAC.7